MMMKEVDLFRGIFQYLWSNYDLGSDSLADSENPRTSKSLELKILKEYLNINNRGQTQHYSSDTRVQFNQEH